MSLKPILVRLTEAEHCKLFELAHDHRVSMSQLIRNLLADLESEDA